MKSRRAPQPPRCTAYFFPSPSFAAAFFAIFSCSALASLHAAEAGGSLSGGGEQKPALCERCASCWTGVLAQQSAVPLRHRPERLRRERVRQAPSALPCSPLRAAAGPVLRAPPGATGLAGLQERCAAATARLPHCRRWLTPPPHLSRLCAGVRPSSFFLSSPAFSFRFWARARSMSRWLPRVCGRAGRGGVAGTGAAGSSGQGADPGRSPLPLDASGWRGLLFLKQRRGLVVAAKRRRRDWLHGCTGCLESPAAVRGTPCCALLPPCSTRSLADLPSPLHLLPRAALSLCRSAGPRCMTA